MNKNQSVIVHVENIPSLLLLFWGLFYVVRTVEPQEQVQSSKQQNVRKAPVITLHSGTDSQNCMH